MTSNPDGRTLIFVRHGQTEWNAERRMQGQLDSPLTNAGVQQAEAAARFLKGQRVDAAYVSPLGRVRETWKIISPDIAVSPTFDDRLMEWNSGQWSGHKFVDLKDVWPGHFREWEEDRFVVRPPDGENYEDMVERVKPFLDDALATTARRILILSHGMIARAMLHYLLGLSAVKTLSIRQRNDTIIRVHISAENNRYPDHYTASGGPFRGLPVHRKG